MNELAKKLISIILCVIVGFLTAAAILTGVVRQTVFSEEYYLATIAQPEYLKKVKEAILEEYKTVAAASDIPEEVLEETLDDAALHAMLRSHIHSAVAFFNDGDEYKDPVYPAGLISKPLYAYLESQTASGMPDDKAYARMDKTAYELAGMIRAKVCVIDVSSFDQGTARMSALGFLRIAKKCFIPSVGLLGVFMLALIFSKLFSARVWLHEIFASVWVGSSFVFVPASIFFLFAKIYDIHVQEEYVKFFVSGGVTRILYYLLALGGILFLGCSVALAILKLTEKRKRRVHR